MHNNIIRKYFYHRPNEVKQFKFNLVWGIALLYGLALLSTFPVYLILGYMKLSAINLLGIIMLLPVFYMLIKQNAVYKASYYFCISHQLFLIAYIYFSGGALNLVLGFYFLVLILFANFNLGARCGFIASVLALITISTFAVLSSTGFTYPYSEDLKGNLLIFTIIPAIIIFFYFNYIIYNYLRARDHLESELQTALRQKDDLYKNLRFNHDQVARLNRIQQSCISHLEQSESRHKTVQHLANLGNWSYNFKTNQIECSEEIFYQLGLNPEQQAPVLREFLDIIHEDDLRLLQKHFRIAIRDGSATFEIRVVRLQHETGYLRIAAKPLYDESDNVMGIYGSSLDITDFRKVQENIQKSEAFLKASQTIASIGSWELDLTNGDMRWSDETYRIFEVTEGTDLNLHSIIAYFDTASGQAFKKAVYECISLGVSFDLTLGMPLRSDHKKWLRAMGKVRFEQDRPVRLWGVFQEITRQKENEDKILQSEAKYREVVNNIREVIFRIDLNTSWSFLNPAWEEITGYTIHESLGEPVENYIHTDDIGKHNDYMQAVFYNKYDYVTYELKLLTKKGDYRWVEVYLGLIKNSDFKVTGYSGTINDITEEKKSREALIREKENALQASKAKENFFSTISHEMRTPLNAIVGFTQLLIDDKPDKDQLERLKALRFSSNSLLTLINDILDFHKINSGTIALEKSIFSIHDLVGSIISALEYKAYDKDVKLKYAVDRRLKYYVTGDSVRLYQIINNLVDNALKFTRKGTVLLKIMQTEQADGQVTLHFEVKDTGIGIPEDKYKQIFDPFSQAGPDTTRKYGGSGLGLAITGKLIALLGGEIYVESELNKGTCFGFSLVYETAGDNNDEHIQMIKETGTHELEKLSGYRVLIAEDNNLNMMVLKQFLSKWQFKVETACNGNEVLDIIEHKDFDLILMDLYMPDKDGFETTRKLRSHSKYKNIPVFALTASTTASVRHKVYQAGMDDYIAKPFSPEELQRKIIEHLKMGRVNYFSAMH